MFGEFVFVMAMVALGGAFGAEAAVAAKFVNNADERFMWPPWWREQRPYSPRDGTK